MTRSFFKKAVTLAMAGTIALGTLGASATPAAALSKSEKNFLGALIGLGAVAVIVDDMNKNNGRATVTRRDEPRRVTTPRVVSRVRHDIIPARCVEQVRMNGARRDVVSARCVSRVDRRVELPTRCRFDIRDRHGKRETVYGRNCLEAKGFRVSHR